MTSKFLFVSSGLLGLFAFSPASGAAVSLPSVPDATVRPADALPSGDDVLPTFVLDHPLVMLFPNASSSADEFEQTAGQQTTDSHGEPAKPKPQAGMPLDANGNVIPLNHRQPQRILGFMPNFRSVSVGEKVHPPGWKYNFTVATRQAFDYSSFVFLGLTSISAEALNEHPVLGKGIGGFYSYTWRGFLDKTDGTYLQGWLLPSLLHEDTRYYPLGDGHPVVVRALYVISRQGVTRTYGGHQTPNLAGLGGKVLTQVISRYYYPTGATSFGVLAEKFGYSAMRDVAFTSIREFYPDIAAHFVRKHREKVARIAAADAAAAQSSSTVKKP